MCIRDSPWIVPHAKQGQDLNDFPHLKRWFDAIAARPAVQREMCIRDSKGPVELPRMPDLLRENAGDGLFARLSPATRDTIAQAKNPKDANTYLLASPEFMRR